jgi:tetratricopeptide (TPR) repeat protein
LRDRGHAQAALGEYRAALELAPANAGVRARVAAAALKSGDRPGAEAALGTLRDVRAPYGSWLALRGQFDREAGRAEEARASFDHALAVDPLNRLVACEGDLGSPADPARRALCESVLAHEGGGTPGD